MIVLFFLQDTDQNGGRMHHWLFDSIFYHVYPLGFCGAPEANDFVSRPAERLRKVGDWIGHMIGAGVNSLYIGPLFESSTHGYDTKDYFTVDRRLGTNETLGELVGSLHGSGIRVVLDAVFNHVGRDFPQFKDLAAKGKSSDYAHWFSGVDFGKRSKFNDPFSYDCWNGHESLVKLNLANPEVKKHLFDAVSSWVDRFGIDGLRLDAADCMDTGFLRELRAFCRWKKGDFALIGEVIHGDYRKWANAETLDSVTNYENYKSLYSSHNDGNYFELAYSLNRQYGDNGMYRDLCLYNFADNHDVTRIASQLKKREYLYPLACLLFTMPGAPSIYYGSEFGVEGAKGRTSDRELRPDLNLAYLYENPPEQGLLPVIRKLAHARGSYPALRYGDYRQLLVKSRQFVFAREYGNEVVIIGVNSDWVEAEVECRVPERYGSRRFYDVLNDREQIDLTGNKLAHKIWPNWGFVLVSG